MIEHGITNDIGPEPDKSTANLEIHAHQAEFCDTDNTASQDP